MLPASLVFLDTETTGLSSYRNRIIEIGLLRVENGKVVKKFTTLINPHMYVSPFVFELTHITQEELEKAPSFIDIAQMLAELCADAVLVAHNVRFDYAFLKHEFLRIGQKFTTRQFCSAKLSRKLFPIYPHHNLDSIIDRFDLSCKKRHRAFDDAKVVWDFYKKLIKMVPQEALEKAINAEMKHPSFPLNISEETLSCLPEQPGVYIMYGKTGIPLYVGKSVNIKDRVLSHFASDHKQPFEMQLSQQVTSIETIPTAGELGALLTESRLIKQLQPLYNKMLRQTRLLTVLTAFVNARGYEEIHMQEVQDIESDNLDSIRGVFRSKRHAKEYLIALAKKHALCEKLLGLEKTKDACFGYRLGICKGACINKENPLTYNTRSIMAFSKEKIKPWIAKGAVAITEENSFTHQKDTFIVDKWCLLSQVSSADDLLNETTTKSHIFDVDTYKILIRYLRDEKNLKKIRYVRESDINILHPRDENYPV